MLCDDLKQLRDEKNIPIADLSELSGVPVSSINRILSGKTENPGFSVVVDLVRAMGGSVDSLVGIQRETVVVYKEGVKEMDAETKALYEHRIKDKDHVIKEKNTYIKFLAISVCVLVGFILFLLAYDLLNPSAGWILR